MKKAKKLLVALIALLSCLGVTYAAHYAGIDAWSAKLEEGDTFNEIYSFRYNKNDGSKNEINYYVPTYEDGVLNGCKYKLHKTDTYEENKTHVTPTIEEKNYVWSRMGPSWMYNGCEYPTIYLDNSTTETRYYLLDSEELHLFAFPKMEIKIECDKEVFENEEPIECKVILNAPVRVKKLEFIINSNELEIQETTLLDNKFTLDEESKKVSYGGPSNWGNTFDNESIVSFKIVGVKENQNTNSITEEVSITGINYSGEGVGTQQLEDKTKPIEIIDEEDDADKEANDKEADENNENDKVDNPKTGVENYYALFVIMLLISGVILYQVKDKDIFKGI